MIKFRPMPIKNDSRVGWWLLFCIGVIGVFLGTWHIVVSFPYVIKTNDDGIRILLLGGNILLSIFALGKALQKDRHHRSGLLEALLNGDGHTNRSLPSSKINYLIELVQKQQDRWMEQPDYYDIPPDKWIGTPRDTPEERVRQWALSVLQYRFGFSIQDIETEKSIRVGDNVVVRADIVIHRPSLIVVECKQLGASVNKAKLQGLSYGALLSAKYVVITNGREWHCFVDSGNEQLQDRYVKIDNIPHAFDM